MPGGIYDYMYELHGSPFQRLMIAEINASYPVDFVIMDAAKAFVDGGPDKGTEVAPGLMLASADRVALDAAGVALLREFGCTSLGKKPVFELDQIRRAAELGVGAASAAAVELVPLDERGPGSGRLDPRRGSGWSKARVENTPADGTRAEIGWGAMLQPKAEGRG